ncbi:DNA polymerase III subunit gamma/tau [Salinarimonas soli]|uniref:DNA polymerase III subunit gamma/tau n=1 Tax=Salinarimonas soli TaxID=1638099 RepID=A0A5B2UWN6_9HYPH|nr:DNA polymerase III subunit gamma/tau [Salinarimonas soli]KAA2231563.1 DNA polymerase III subunit gamma/tau [Salinarimonas soli]
MTDQLSGLPPDDEPGFAGFDAPPPSRPEPGPGYRVLARKYRPRSFDDLIGQEAMVRTLSNAFRTGRIPQAWMLTGVRGVGKTTTARILARGLNYQRRDGTGGPTIDMPDMGLHCEAIVEGRHIDVMEIDAASNNGVDNVRQINDAVRYAPVSARYKVYIVDEVHMLSTGAFNAFLKTLEEPPPHAKFVFATTEIHKVPVTILSRCQRFDLRRVEAGVLVEHLNRICGMESVTAEPEALSAIARAAEGSVRDSLSLLDQAIAHGAGRVGLDTVRDMLGLADRAQVVDLFEAVMRGDVPAAFAGLRGQYDAGADPAAVMQELAGFTHLVTRLKLVPDAGQDASLTEIERQRGMAFAQGLSVRTLSRAWQILLKAVPEVQAASRPVAAAEMALVRLAYAADLPTPDEALRMLKDGGPLPSGSPSTPSPPRSNGATALASRPVLATSQPQPAPAAPRPQPAAVPEMRLRRFEDVVALAGERRDIRMKAALERDVRLVRFEDGQIEFALAEGGNRNLAGDLARCLTEWTGRRWMVALSSEAGQPTLREQAAAAERELKSNAASHPLVQAVLTRFPGAQIVDVRQRADEAAADETAPEAAILGDDAPAALETEADDDLDF